MMGWIDLMSGALNPYNANHVEPFVTRRWKIQFWARRFFSPSGRMCLKFFLSFCVCSCWLMVSSAKESCVYERGAKKLSICWNVLHKQQHHLHTAGEENCMNRMNLIGRGSNGFSSLTHLMNHKKCRSAAESFYFIFHPQCSDNERGKKHPL